MPAEDDPPVETEPATYELRRFDGVACASLDAYEAHQMSMSQLPAECPKSIECTHISKIVESRCPVNLPDGSVSVERILTIYHHCRIDPFYYYARRESPRSEHVHPDLRS